MEKRSVILKEIEHWRRNKVLPEQYCDFLRNLYLSDEEEQKSWTRISKQTIANSHWRIWALIGLALTAISLLIFNFNQFPLSFQLLLSCAILVISYFFGFRLRQQNKSLSNLLLGVGTIYMLSIGPYLMKLYDVNQVLWVLGYIVCCSVLWIAIGIIKQFGLLQFCGCLGLISMYGWILHTRVDEMNWLIGQLFWIPITAVFMLLGWILRERYPTLGIVYFIVGIVLWFVPDVYLMFISESSSQWMQVLFTSKIIVTVVILFILRKKWTEWVV